jgi:hypothetical protein
VPERVAPVRTRWVLIPCNMLVAMLAPGYSYRVVEGSLPEDVRVREIHVAGTSISLLVESESFSVVPDGNVPEIAPSVEFYRDSRARSGVLH